MTRLHFSACSAARTVRRQPAGRVPRRRRSAGRRPPGGGGRPGPQRDGVRGRRRPRRGAHLHAPRSRCPSPGTRPWARPGCWPRSASPWRQPARAGRRAAACATRAATRSCPRAPSGRRASSGSSSALPPRSKRSPVRRAATTTSGRGPGSTRTAAPCARVCSRSATGSPRTRRRGPRPSCCAPGWAARSRSARAAARVIRARPAADGYVEIGGRVGAGRGARVRRALSELLVAHPQDRQRAAGRRDEEHRRAGDEVGVRDDRRLGAHHQRGQREQPSGPGRHGALAQRPDREQDHAHDERRAGSGSTGRTSPSPGGPRARPRRPRARPPAAVTPRRRSPRSSRRS